MRIGCKLREGKGRGKQLLLLLSVFCLLDFDYVFWINDVRTGAPYSFDFYFRNTTDSTYVFIRGNVWREFNFNFKLYQFLCTMIWNLAGAIVFWREDEIDRKHFEQIDPK